MEVGTFLITRTSVRWLPPHHSVLRAQGFNQSFSTALVHVAWVVLGMCWLAALVSFVDSNQRGIPLDTRNTLEGVDTNRSSQFELMVGPALGYYQDYVGVEIGLRGADGGIDLILVKNGHPMLLRCKECKCQQAGTSVARDIHELLTCHNASAIKIVCVGTYKKASNQFAQGKPIVLTSSTQPLGMIRAVLLPKMIHATPLVRSGSRPAKV
ncbi:restriction endonuclease [Xanthomonas sp. F14]